ncbi:hypothetical protein Ae201684_003972 [Aphanomyces euteiches]|uniref:Uncharacterized protein n=1 Tax=Aphanomyces euteiches TaxID=100861 RepID=A0A6G0XJQ0_9STRA|nr:hypothetical protein Ae201684_003972 [Aphanomyces euteiches]
MLTGATKTSVSPMTANRRMQRIGYRYGVWKKAVYLDGHERDDVKRYREQFCAAFLGHSSQMRFYSCESMGQVNMPIDMTAPEVVWVTHDESVFYANDDGGRGWSNDDERPDLHKKGRGRSIMVSDFSARAMYDSSTVTKGTLLNDHVMKQIHGDVLVASKAMHPEYIALFTFDQSTNHTACAVDALRATSMNMIPGGAQALLRPGFYNGTVQEMVIGADSHFAGQAKGLKQVLSEHGIDITARKIKIKQDRRLLCPPLHGVTPGLWLKIRSWKRQLSQRAIFVPPQVPLRVEPDRVVLRFARLNCDYSFVGLQLCVSKSLESLPLSSIRKFFRRCFHFIQSYSYGCDYKLTKFVHKKYKSHRRIPESILHEKD